MLSMKDSFVKASYSMTDIESKVLIRPLDPEAPTPTGEPWKVFNDRVLENVPSLILLDMLRRELNRQLTAISYDGIHGYYFTAGNTLEVSQLIERASLRYLALTKGVVLFEITKALMRRFDSDPRLIALLSDEKDAGSAANDVAMRAVEKLLFTWGIEKVPATKAQFLVGPILEAFYSDVYRRIDEDKQRLSYVMTISSKENFKKILDRFNQFEGFDPRIDKALKEYSFILSYFPSNGQAVCGQDLTDFWDRMIDLSASLRIEFRNAKNQQ